ncbi:MAG: thioredoxin family protein [Bacteroidota bacterium]
MALTPTTSISLDFKAPDFTLPEPRTQKSVSLKEAKGEKGTLVIFMCNHCPYVIHIIEELVQLTNDYKNKGISVVGINSNDVENYPADSPEKMVAWAEEHNFPFPYLFDESQEVAKAYDAACTPDFSLFDSDLKCVYRGRLDGSRPGNGVPVTGEDLRAALDALLKDQPIPAPQLPSMGCNIKWK